MVSRRTLVVGLLTLQLSLAGTALGAAGPYPPPEGSGRVEPSRIKVGECATFFGEGFAPGATVAVTDNDQPRGTATARQDGQFAKELCYPSGSQPGRHRLAGTGEARAAGSPTALSRLALVGVAAAAEQLTVTADLIVQGVQQGTASGEGSSAGGAGGSASGAGGSAGGGSTTNGVSLPRTGIPALVASVLGVGLVGAGAALLLVADRRHRRRRRATTA